MTKTCEHQRTIEYAFWILIFFFFIVLRKLCTPLPLADLKSNALQNTFDDMIKTMVQTYKTKSTTDENQHKYNVQNCYFNCFFNIFFYSLLLMYLLILVCTWWCRFSSSTDWYNFTIFYSMYKTWCWTIKTKYKYGLIETFKNDC
jgi:hypothetical protein